MHGDVMAWHVTYGMAWHVMPWRERHGMAWHVACKIVTAAQKRGVGVLIMHLPRIGRAKKRPALPYVTLSKSNQMCFLEIFFEILNSGLKLKIFSQLVGSS